MSEIAVEARGLGKVYGRQRALGGPSGGIDLTLRAGECTALLGPNGARAAQLAAQRAPAPTDER